MTRHARLVAGAACLFAVALPAVASAQKDLSTERVSITFRDKLAQDALPVLARALEYDLVLDPRLDALLTIDLRSVTARTALDAICDSVGCRWRAERKKLFVDDLSGQSRMSIADTEVGRAALKRGMHPMQLGVKDLDSELPLRYAFGPAPLYVAFYSLGRLYDADADVAPPLKNRKITIELPSSSLRHALDALCEKAGCRWEMIESKPRRVLRVTPR